jgi:hypothetical protein
MNFRYQTGRQKFLDRILASAFPWIQFPSSFFVHPILIYWCCSQIFELFHILYFTATLLTKLPFVEPCITRCVFYITNEMQRIQCSLLLSALYVFRAVSPPIIRSLWNCMCSLRYCHAFLLSTAGVDGLELKNTDICMMPPWCCTEGTI